MNRLWATVMETTTRTTCAAQRTGMAQIFSAARFSSTAPQLSTARVVSSDRFFSATRLMGMALLLLLLSSTGAEAQRIAWRGSPQMEEGSTSGLALTFMDCQPRDDTGVQLPEVQGLSFGSPSTQSQFVMNGLQQSRTYSLVYPVSASQKGTYKIPSFYLETTHGRLLVPEFTLVVGQSKTQGLISAHLIPEKTTVYAGQVFDLQAVLLVQEGQSATYDPNSTVEWKPQGINFENWSPHERASYKNPPSVGTVRRSRAVIQNPGRVTLPESVQQVSLMVGRQSFGGFFTQPSYEARNVRSEPVVMEVLPLPAGQPPEFTGAVGEFQLKSKVVPEEVAVGEPITWSLSLSGSGNWTQNLNVPSRDAPANMKPLKPSFKTRTPEGKLFDSEITEEIVLIPQEPGEYRLGPTYFTYFDPKAAQYRTVEAGATVVRVLPAEQRNPLSFSASQPGSPGLNNALSATDSGGSAPLEFANRLPKDPQITTELRKAPLGAWGYLLAPAPFLLALLTWLLLARRRAAQTDPLRLRRLARKEALQILSRLRLDDPASVRAELPPFQRAAAVLCGLNAVLPSAAEIEAVLDPVEGAVVARNWHTIWEDADRALFAPDAALPPDWQSRAQELVQGIRLAPLPATDLFLMRNLFPSTRVTALLAAAALSLLTAPASPAADGQVSTGDNALDAYGSGDFSRAAELWSDRVNTTPTDVSLRNNLALALAQQSRWEEAAAHLTAARILSPRNNNVAWNFELALQRAGFRDPALEQWSGLGASPAVWLSPAEWMLALWCGSLLLVLGVVIFLLRQYGCVNRRSPAGLYLQGIVPVLGLLLLLLSAFALYQYGPLAEPAAGIICKKSSLYSIPTDADTQQRRPVPPGTIVVVKKSFLGWLQVEISYQSSGMVKQRHRETGWLRKQQVLPLYRATGA